MWTTGKLKTEHTPILIDGAVVEQVESFKFLGVHINNKLSWSKHTKTVLKRARENLFLFRRLKRFGMGPQILKKFYSCTIKSWLHHCLVRQLLCLQPQGSTEGSGTTEALQRVVRTAQYITGSKLPGPLYQAVSEEGPKNGQRLQLH